MKTVLVTGEQINLGVRAMATRLNSIFNHEFLLDKCPTFVSIMDGGDIFCQDLIEKISFIHYHEKIKVNSYNGQERGEVVFSMLPKLKVGYAKVILVDDFCDSGSTMSKVKAYFEKEYGSKVYCVTFLKRKSTHFQDLMFCREVEGDDWLYGYGLDDNGKNRELREIYKLT